MNQSVHLFLVEKRQALLRLGYFSETTGRGKQQCYRWITGMGRHDTIDF